MVVLSSGLCPSAESSKLAEVCQIETNHYDFAESADFVPTASSREGIYVAGSFEGPKDVPESVTQASGAAAQAMELLADVRGSQVEDKEYPPEKDVSDQEFLRSLNEVVMIQCVGSREPERMVCSRVCCTEAIKNAIAMKRVNPKATVAILYRDIRTYGFKEDYYNEARKLGVLFFRYDLDGKPIVSQNSSSQLEVRVRDLNSGLNLSFSPDVLVLSAAMTPSADNEKVGTAFKVPITLEGFFLEAHMKLRPVDFASDGLFLCGTCHSPKFIDESITQAQAAAAKAVGILSKKVMEISGVVSVVDQDKCAVQGNTPCQEN